MEDKERASGRDVHFKFHLGAPTQAELEFLARQTRMAQSLCVDPFQGLADDLLYLNPLDHLVAAQGFEMTRYADDFVVQCRSQEEAEAAMEEIKQWAQENGLTIHPAKTRIVDERQKGGFDFLGYHFERAMKWPRQKSLDKFKDTIRHRKRRTQGKSLGEVIDCLTPTMRGWFEYFKHSHWNVFPGIDVWGRMRLRSILRKHQGKKGRGRGSDHQRWPKVCFDALGFFSLEKAHRVLLQSR